jgi:hypothetical protein
VQETLKQVPASVAYPFSLLVVVQGMDLALQPGQDKWDNVVSLKQGQDVLVRPDQHILAILDRNASEVHIV